MDLLVLGGTAWLSRAVAAEAVARGHVVTCLARGLAGRSADGTRLVVADGDRPDAYDAVAGERWDAVVDVARHPGHVRRAVAALEPAAGRYLFVSSANVYAGHGVMGEDEDAELLPPLGSDVMESMETYGEAKVACEQAVLRAFGGGRTLVARAALIGGPGDVSGRSGYWPWRFAHPSNPEQAVLLPDDPQVPTAIIDVRDLAAWLVGCAEAGTTGVFDTAGEPRGPGRSPGGGPVRGRSLRAAGGRDPGLAHRARRRRLDGTDVPAAVARRPRPRERSAVPDLISARQLN